jgi:hypothetical protein
MQESAHAMNPGLLITLLSAESDDHLVVASDWRAQRSDY